VPGEDGPGHMVRKQLTNTNNFFFFPSVGKSNKNIFKKHLVRPGFFCSARVNLGQ
jgi:hypothetical protein